MIVRYDEMLNKQLLDEHGNVTRILPRGEALTLSKKDRCKLIPSSPERVQIIHDIFTWYAYHGLGFKGIADRLNTMGISCPRGGVWSQYHKVNWSMTTIRDMLMNPAYVGDFVWNRQSFAKFYRIEQGKAVPRRATPGSGPDLNSPGGLGSGEGRASRDHLPQPVRGREEAAGGEEERVRPADLSQRPRGEVTVSAERAHPLSALWAELAGLHHDEEPAQERRLSREVLLLRVRGLCHQGERRLPAVRTGQGGDRGMGDGGDRADRPGLPGDGRRGPAEADAGAGGGAGRRGRGLGGCGPEGNARSKSRPPSRTYWTT